MAVPHNVMSSQDVAAFLDAPRHAVFSTNRKEGPPLLSPVWYLFEKEVLYLLIGLDSAKYRMLQRDPAVGICIPGNHPDARAVMIYGQADFLRKGGDGFDDLSWRINRRYFESDEETQAYLASIAGGGENVILIVRPDKLIAQDYND